MIVFTLHSQFDYGVFYIHNEIIIKYCELTLLHREELKLLQDNVNLVNGKVIIPTLTDIMKFGVILLYIKYKLIGIRKDINL